MQGVDYDVPYHRAQVGPPTSLELEVQGLWFRVQGVKFRIQGSKLRV